MNDLRHIGHTFINFDNGSFQWVDVRRFRFTTTPGPSHMVLLAAVITHDTFGNDYAARPGDNPERHGPYWRDRITPGSYDRVDPAEAERALRTWSEQFVAIASETRLQQEQHVLEPLDAADAVYRLGDLGPEAFHDWGGVHNEFHGFVLIKAPAGRGVAARDGGWRWAVKVPFDESGEASCWRRLSFTRRRAPLAFRRSGRGRCCTRCPERASLMARSRVDGTNHRNTTESVRLRAGHLPDGSGQDVPPHVVTAWEEIVAIARIDGGSVPRQGKPWTSPDALVVRGFNGAVAVEARPGARLWFGRAPDPAAEGMRLGEDDLRVSRTHGVLVHRQQWWWLRNTGSLPIEISGGRRVHKADEEYPLDPGHTTLVITGSNDRKHILHLYINGPDGGRQPYPVPDGRTVEQIVWPLTPRQRRVLVVLGQRYLRSGDVDPQPLTRQGTVDHLNELWPGERWTLRKVDHVVEPVRLHLHAKGVRGVVEAEVDPPVGNKLSHNLLVELTVKTATLTPGDLRLIDGGE